LESPFIQNDLRILRKYFDVRVVDSNFIMDRFNFLYFLKTILHLIIGVLWADIAFIWFADKDAYWVVRFSNFLKKKSIVVVGGYDVARVPEIKYGALLNQKNASRTKYVLENTDVVLTVDDGLREDAINNLDIEGNNIKTIPTGYDYKKFKPNGVKEDLVISVSTGNNWMRIQLKGLDTFVKSAKLLPNVRFLVIGIEGDCKEKLKRIASSNVDFIGLLSQAKLIEYYQRAKVYCQLSIREGLPNALCEAMLCECIPVGTNVQGVKTAIGETGFYVPYCNTKATAYAIKKALSITRKKETRERIRNMFTLQERERRIVKEINGLLI
jgi:glycosyltransferase involved in cell wall biosynthesis